MGNPNQLRICFYGDDFTGSTDALEQLTLAGLKTALFIEPPTRVQLVHFKNLQAVGVAGTSRAMTPETMERELPGVFQQLKRLGAPHVHYKVCSTFDSSPAIGSIGRVIDLAAGIFPSPFVPLLVAAPALGRYCVFGNLFARMGIGSQGAIHRLDRHPAMSHHPITPADESDLRLHLARQTKKSIALFDILQLELPEKAAAAALKAILAGKPDVVLFDALEAAQMGRIGKLMDAHATRRRPLFSVGSSGVEMALGAHWSAGRKTGQTDARKIRPVKQLLIGSGSCSPVTEKQIAWALRHGFTGVALDTTVLVGRNENKTKLEIERATAAAAKLLRAGRSVIVHTALGVGDVRRRRTLAAFKRHGLSESGIREASARLFGTALGTVLRNTLAFSKVKRLGIAGGDTSSFAARALGIQALEMIAPLVPGAPLCRAFAPDSPADGLEVNFKGGQVGAEDYFGRLHGRKS